MATRCRKCKKKVVRLDGKYRVIPEPLCAECAKALIGLIVGC